MFNGHFILKGGRIKSKSDNDVHYISPHQLRILYGLNPRKCIYVNNQTNAYTEPFNIVLGPRYHGDYKEYLQEKLKEVEEYFD